MCVCVCVCVCELRYAQSEDRSQATRFSESLRLTEDRDMNVRRQGSPIVTSNCTVFLCVFVTAVPLTNCSCGERGIVEDMCYKRRRAESCVD